MDAAGFRVLKDVLAAPGLWAFAIAAGAVGLAEAVEACRTRCLPAAVLAEMVKIGYSIDHLPPADAIERMHLGVRLEVERVRSLGRGEHLAPCDVAVRLAVDPREAQRAYEQLRAFGWNPRRHGPRQGQDDDDQEADHDDRG